MIRADFIGTKIPCDQDETRQEKKSYYTYTVSKGSMVLPTSAKEKMAQALEQIRKTK
jgi:hypothetical protein